MYSNDRAWRSRRVTLSTKLRNSDELVGFPKEAKDAVTERLDFIETLALMCGSTVPFRFMTLGTKVGSAVSASH
jgi:hypothetical protein